MREKGRVRVSVKEEWDEYASFFPWLAFFFFFSCGFETGITWFVILLLGLLTWECECRVASRLVYCGGMRCWVGWWNCCRLWVGFFCVVSCKQGSYIHQPIWSRCWRWRGCLYTSSRRQDFRLRIGLLSLSVTLIACSRYTLHCYTSGSFVTKSADGFRPQHYRILPRVEDCS